LTRCDPTTAMQSHAEFAELIAAVVTVYPEHIDSKHDKTSLRQVEVPRMGVVVLMHTITYPHTRDG
jgi:hypothetical protein